MKRKKPTNKEITMVLNGLIMEIEAIKIRLTMLEDNKVGKEEDEQK